MDVLCPGCGEPLASVDEVCPRCALSQAIAPVTPSLPATPERYQPPERRLPVSQDREIRRSLRILLVIGIGLTLLLFAVIAIIVWVLFGA
jgi:NMD protein affecting ribosome stability and mRNA decay